MILSVWPRFAFATVAAHSALMVAVVTALAIWPENPIDPMFCWMEAFYALPMVSMDIACLMEQFQ